MKRARVTPFVFCVSTCKRLFRSESETKMNGIFASSLCWNYSLLWYLVLLSNFRITTRTAWWLYVVSFAFAKLYSYNSKKFLIFDKSTIKTRLFCIVTYCRQVADRSWLDNTPRQNAMLQKHRSNIRRIFEMNVSPLIINFLIKSILRASLLLSQRNVFFFSFFFFFLSLYAHLHLSSEHSINVRNSN